MVSVEILKIFRLTDLMEPKYYSQKQIIAESFKASFIWVLLLQILSQIEFVLLKYL